MKAVLISIQPKWCELIAIGKKTVEVRKSAPKLDVPFKCYIYETQDKQYEKSRVVFSNGRGFAHATGKVIGEFVCDRIDEYKNNFCAWRDKNGNQFDVGKLLSDARLTLDKMSDYISGSVKFYGWHISDLVICDKPKELEEFRKPCNFQSDCAFCKRAIKRPQVSYGGKLEYFMYDCDSKIRRAPQSYVYVEEL